MRSTLFALLASVSAGLAEASAEWTFTTDAKPRAFRIRHVGDMREAWPMLFSDKRLEAPLWHRAADKGGCSR